MRPNLSDPAGRAAYRRELRGLARPWRMFGFVLILLGVAGLFYTQRQGADGGLRLASWAALAAGWAVWIGVIVYRTRYHRARMTED